ncbi:mitochondral 37S ribosomal protein S27 [Rhizina undulata]
MATPSRERLLELMKVSCRIFSTTFNPTGMRTGNKVLRQRLRGPTMLEYYPRRGPTIKDMQKAFPEMVFVDEDQVQRLEDIQRAKARGKGAPKKIRTPPEKKSGRK